MAELVGREGEERQLLSALERSLAGLTAVLLEGEAGIGKTVLWKAAIGEAEARGYRPFMAGVAEFETGLAYVGLADLMETVEAGNIGALPAVQRSALDAALLRSDDSETQTDWRAVSAAVLSLLRAYAERGPVLIALDDIQWLDHATANVLSTALRRLESEPIFVVMTQRVPSPPGPFEPNAIFRDRLEFVAVNPLGWEDLGQIIRTRLELKLAAATVKRIHQTSGGNPFYALEIARSLGDVDLTREETAPVPRTLTDVIGRRLAHLSDAALQVLLIMASVSQPTVALAKKALGDEQLAASGIDEARRADVIDRRDDALRFTHPLFASTIYEETSEEDRMALHARLSELIEDTEQRAAHLARARTAPSEEVAAALDDAARIAKSRGAIERAAQLAWMAVDFTPSGRGTERADRIATAAEHEYMFGDRARLERVLVEALPTVPRGPARARLWLIHSEFSERHSDSIAGLTEALEDSRDDPALRAWVHIHRSRVLWLNGELAAAESDARDAVRLAQGLDDRALLVAAMTEIVAQQVLAAHPDAARSIAAAVAFPEAKEVEPLYDSPIVFQGLHAECNDDLDLARTLYEELLELADERGDINSYSGILLHLMLTECRAGRFHRADEIATFIAVNDADLLEDQSNAIALFCRGLADVHLGRIEEARRSASKGAEIAEKLGDLLFLAENLWVLGLAELSTGDHVEACRHLERIPELAEKMGMQDPNRLLFRGDLVEALIGAGRLEDAQHHLEQLQERAEELNRTRALAVAARCQAMLTNQRGDLDEAMSAIERSLEFHDKIPDQPFELARTLLTKGIVERRAKQRGAARESLGRAVKLFVELGTPVWADKAEAEAKRIGGRAPSTDALTPTEEQVAALVAEGLSNKEVADRLFLSIKTVEANLSRIYRKMEVRSRTQLAQKIHGAAEPLGQT